MTASPLTPLPAPLRELATQRRWVLWRREVRDGTPTKVPYQLDGRKASTTTPHTWSTYTDVTHTAAASGYDGVGYVLAGDGVIAIDLDHCRDTDGTIASWATAIVMLTSSYTEVSPSGEGLRILLHGSALPPGPRKVGHVEIYDDKRFVTVTGNHLPNTPPTLTDRSEVITAIHAACVAIGEHTKPPKVSTPAPPAATAPSTGTALSDQDVIDKLTREDGGKWRDLWAGNWDAHYESQSSADLALATKLAFYTDRDAGGLERLFSQSGLGQRGKWTTRSDYRQRTIDRAIAGCTSVYRGRTPTPITTPIVVEPPATQVDCPDLVQRIAGLEADLTAAQAQIAQLHDELGLARTDHAALRKQLEDARHERIVVRNLCASTDLDHTYKAPAIALYLAAKHEAHFAEAYERPVDLPYWKIEELTGITDDEAKKKILLGLDAANYWTMSKVPCTTGKMGRYGKAITGFTYRVQFGAREGEAPLTLEQRAKLLCASPPPELYRRKRGVRQIPTSGHAPHPAASFTRKQIAQDICSLDGTLFRETVLGETTITPPVQPESVSRPLSAAAIVAVPTTSDALDSGSTGVSPSSLVAPVQPESASRVDTRPVCRCGAALSPGEACFTCDVSACRECGAEVVGTLSRFCRAACRNPRPSRPERYDRPPPELLVDYGAAGGAG
jgi:hypothetical protein